MRTESIEVAVMIAVWNAALGQLHCCCLYLWSLGWEKRVVNSQAGSCLFFRGVIPGPAPLGEQNTLL